MPRILGYGEDVLTLWALSKRLEEFLAQPNVGDASSADAALVIYRPSFGRGSRRTQKGVAVPRATFGEFDAIVATARCVYLIESKWEHSSEIKRNGIIRLRSEQASRHEIFDWLVREWWRETPPDWSAFATTDRVKAFHKKFKEHKLAESGSRLSKNLEFVLRQLAGFRSENIKHVLLFFHFEETPRASGVEDEKFVLVPFRATKTPESMYLEITSDGLTGTRAGVVQG